MSALKWIFGLVFGLLVLVVAGIGVILATVDPNDHKDWAIQKAQEQGWELALNGDLSLSFWPSIAIDLPPTQLSSVTAQQSIQFEDARVSLAVMPLITEQRAEVSTLILDRPIIRWDLDAPLPGSTTETESPAQTSTDSSPLAIAIGGLQITQADIELYNGDQLAHSITLPNLTLGALAPNTWVPLDAELSYAAQDVPNTPIRLSGEMNAPADFGQVQMRDLTLSSLGVDMSGELLVMLDPLQVTGQIEMAAFNARQIAEHFGAPLETQNPEALSEVSLSLLLGNDGPVYANSLNLTLDDKQWTGQGGLRTLDPLSFNLALNGESLRLDDYLAPAAPAGATASPAANEVSALSPLAALAGINGDVQLTLAQLETQGLMFETIEASAEIRDRRIHFTQLAANAYQGQFLGNAVINGRSAVPSLSADFELSSLQIQGLLDDLAGFSDLSGTAMMQGNLTGEGLDAAQIMASLDGNLSGELVNGAFKGLAVDSLVCDGIATLVGGQSKLATSADTPFDAVRFNADIRQGIADVDTLKLGLVNLSVAGGGTLSLPGQTLDLALDASLTGDKQITGCSIPSFVQNAKLPLRCQGGFADNPASLCSLDTSRMDSLVSEQAKAQISAKKDELKAKTQAKIESKKAELADDIKAKAADKLKSLFK